MHYIHNSAPRKNSWFHVPSSFSIRRSQLTRWTNYNHDSIAHLTYNYARWKVQRTRTQHKGQVDQRCVLDKSVKTCRQLYVQRLHQVLIVNHLDTLGHQQSIDIDVHASYAELPNVHSTTCRSSQATISTSLSRPCLAWWLVLLVTRRTDDKSCTNRACARDYTCILIKTRTADFGTLLLTTLA